MGSDYRLTLTTALASAVKLAHLFMDGARYDAAYTDALVI